MIHKWNNDHVCGAEACSWGMVIYLMGPGRAEELWSYPSKTHTMTETLLWSNTADLDCLYKWVTPCVLGKYITLSLLFDSSYLHRILYILVYGMFVHQHPFSNMTLLITFWIPIIIICFLKIYLQNIFKWFLRSLNWFDFCTSLCSKLFNIKNYKLQK